MRLICLSEHYHLKKKVTFNGSKGIPPFVPKSRRHLCVEVGYNLDQTQLSSKLKTELMWNSTQPEIWPIGTQVDSTQNSGWQVGLGWFGFNSFQVSMFFYLLYHGIWMKKLGIFQSSKNCLLFKEQNILKNCIKNRKVQKV